MSTPHMGITKVINGKLHTMNKLGEFFHSLRDSWDPAAYFTHLGWNSRAHDAAIAEIGSFEQALAANRAEFEGYPNLMADKNALHDIWFTQYQTSYQTHLLEIKRQARADRRLLDEQHQLTDDEKAEIRRLLKI